MLAGFRNEVVLEEKEMVGVGEAHVKLEIKLERGGIRIMARFREEEKNAPEEK